jgi:YggT family protein
MVLVLFEVIFTITEKPTAFIRKFVPPLRLGGVALDLSFIILLLFVIPLGHKLIDLIL